VLVNRIGMHLRIPGTEVQSSGICHSRSFHC
jgi:hypothetical protein